MEYDSQKELLIVKRDLTIIREELKLIKKELGLEVLECEKCSAKWLLSKTSGSRCSCDTCKTILCYKHLSKCLDCNARCCRDHFYFVYGNKYGHCIKCMITCDKCGLINPHTECFHEDCKSCPRCYPMVSDDFCLAHAHQNTK